MRNQSTRSRWPAAIGVAALCLLAITVAPADEAGETVVVEGSFVAAEPTGSGCQFSPECATRTHLCATMQQLGDPEFRDGVTMSFVRMPQELVGEKVWFSFEAERFRPESWAIVDFLASTCDSLVHPGLDAHGARDMEVPHRTKWLVVLGVEMANVKWRLEGPIEP